MAMFNLTETTPTFNPIEQDLSLNGTYAAIYSIVLAWWKTEQENAEKGANGERPMLESIMNFDFNGFAADLQQSEAILDEIFTASETCFVPNRMKLLASQVMLRFGASVYNDIEQRLHSSLVNIYGVDEQDAITLITVYPCLWLIHIVQGGVALHIS